jgi:hypothetical protein
MDKNKQNFKKGGGERPRPRGGGRRGKLRFCCEMSAIGLVTRRVGGGLVRVPTHGATKKVALRRVGEEFQLAERLKGLHLFRNENANFSAGPLPWREAAPLLRF